MIEPVLRFDPALLLRAQGIRVAVFDVDGVLTDGQIYIGEDGEAFKAFSTLDGHGLKLLAQGGIVPVVITGRDSPAVRVDVFHALLLLSSGTVSFPPFCQ